MNILLQPYISPRDKATIIHNITLSELRDFTDRLLDRLYVQVGVTSSIGSVNINSDLSLIHKGTVNSFLSFQRLYMSHC